MNCQEFHTVVTELAAAGLMEASTQTQAQAHAAGCPSCRNRLETERALREGLRTLATATATAQAPARVKQNLQAAFRQQMQPPALPVQPVMATRAKVSALRRSGITWLIPVASAALLMVSLGLAWMMFQTNRNLNPTQGQAANAGRIPVPPKVEVSTNSSPQPDNVVTPTGSSSQATNSARSNRNKQKHSNQVPSSRRVVTEPQSETTTDFIPLTFIASSEGPDTSQVVRIQVARTKLIAMGLPLNIERSGEYVTADVMVGDDGVARAIRLVQ
ncbi:MAG: hypothetical protein K1Y36_00960 [Blastocatellia bacterium]|nr:hypothetical protein [Blastocatellia bacterium]